MQTTAATPAHSRRSFPPHLLVALYDAVSELQVIALRGDGLERAELRHLDGVLYKAGRALDVLGADAPDAGLYSVVPDEMQLALPGLLRGLAAGGDAADVDEVLALMPGGENGSLADHDEGEAPSNNADGLQPADAPRELAPAEPSERHADDVPVAVDAAPRPRGVSATGSAVHTQGGVARDDEHGLAALVAVDRPNAEHVLETNGGGLRGASPSIPHGDSRQDWSRQPELNRRPTVYESGGREERARWKLQNELERVRRDLERVTDERDTAAATSARRFDELGAERERLERLTVTQRAALEAQRIDAAAVVAGVRAELAEAFRQEAYWANAAAAEREIVVELRAELELVKVRQ